MTKSEVDSMRKEEVAYNLLLCRMKRNRELLEKVTLYRKKNNRGQLVSNIVCYLQNKNGNTRTENFQLYDDQYLWFLCSLREDFPELDFVDLTADEYKVGENAV